MNAMGRITASNRNGTEHVWTARVSPDLGAALQRRDRPVSNLDSKQNHPVMQTRQSDAAAPYEWPSNHLPDQSQIGICRLWQLLDTLLLPSPDHSGQLEHP